MKGRRKEKEREKGREEEEEKKGMDFCTLVWNLLSFVWKKYGTCMDVWILVWKYGF